MHEVGHLWHCCKLRSKIKGSRRVRSYDRTLKPLRLFSRSMYVAFGPSPGPVASQFVDAIAQSSFRGQRKSKGLRVAFFEFHDVKSWNILQHLGTSCNAPAMHPFSQSSSASSSRPPSVPGTGSLKWLDARCRAGNVGRQPGAGDVLPQPQRLSVGSLERVTVNVESQSDRV